MPALFTALLLVMNNSSMSFPSIRDSDTLQFFIIFEISVANFSLRLLLDKFSSKLSSISPLLMLHFLITYYTSCQIKHILWSYCHRWFEYSNSITLLLLSMLFDRTSTIVILSKRLQIILQFSLHLPACHKLLFI